MRAPFSATFPLEIKNLVTFTEEDGKTTITLSGGPINATQDELDFFKAMFDSMNQGFAGTFDQLRWFGPKGWPLVVSNLDFRVGGVWHFCMKCTGESAQYYGMESWGKAVYHEIVAPERIVYTDSFADAEGNVIKDMPETVVTMTFLEHEGKTKLISHALYATDEALKTVVDMGMIDGITSTWDNLEEFLTENK